MCRLSAIAELTDRAVPGAWRVGLFGSATRCPGDGTCTSGASDVDMVVVHPVGDEHAALDVRRSLVAHVDALGLIADVILLSEREVISTRFWVDENAVDLSAAIVACNRSGSGTGKNDIV
jgi:hypothetical protein